MSRTKVDVITVGRVSMDLFAQNIGAPFEEISGFDTSVGGSPTNIAIGCARLGLRTGLLTAVGDDLVGKLVIHRLKQENVETGYIPVKADTQTGLAIVGVQPPDRFPLEFYRNNPADIHLTIDDAAALPLVDSRALLLSGTALARGTCRDVTYYLAERARTMQVTTFMDLDLRRDQWTHPAAFGVAIRSIVSKLDVVIGTEEEFHAVWGADDESTPRGGAISESQRAELDVALKAYQAKHTCPSVFVVKRGARGVNLLSSDFGSIHIPGFEVDVLNTVGAGDAFASGLLYGCIHGLDWTECARLGNACGAIVVTRNGCSQALPHENEVLEFVAARSSHCTPHRLEAGRI